jgi:hypothetical protein
MPSAEDYRRFAGDCVLLAQQATDTDGKARLLQMAQAWRELAEKKEARPQGD